jgi:hypothetical protein
VIGRGNRSAAPDDMAIAAPRLWIPGDAKVKVVGKQI